MRTYLFILLGTASLLVGLIGGISQEHSMLFGTITGLLLLLPLIWHRPALCAYLLVGGAAVFEVMILGFPDSFTDHVPFFRAPSSVGGPDWFIISGAEFLMVFTLVAVALRRMAVGEKPLRTGPLFWALMFYMVMVSYGLLYGRGTGGNLLVALWEARSQFYLMLAYLVVVNTIQEKRQLVRMMWVLLLGIAFKGVLGTWRWLVTLEGDTSRVTALSHNNSILEHTESYFFAIFLIMVLILFLFRSHRAQLWFALLAATPVFLAFLANERRAGHLVLALGIITLIPLAYRLLRSRRRAILRVTPIVCLVLLAYTGLFWNASGAIAEPARAVRSQFQPGDRDAGSNDYRIRETLNLKYNIQSSPILGQGYGKSIIFYIPLPYLDFVFWQEIPHNTILWVWLRLGFVGFLAFWFLIGRAIVGATIAAKQSSDPYLQSVGVLAVVALVGWILLGAVDMGITDWRVNILIGVFMGLVSLLPELEKKEKSEESSRIAAEEKPKNNGLARLNQGDRQ